MFENPSEETRWLPPRRVMELILITLPSVNRLMQRSARSLIYSSSSSVTLSIPPSLTSFFASPSVPLSLFPISAFSVNQFLALSSHFLLYCLPFLTVFLNSLLRLFSFLSFSLSLSSLHTFNFFLFRYGMRDEPSANPIPKAP